MYSRPQRDREYQDKVQGVRRRQCNTGVQWIRGLLRTSPLLHFPSQRRPLSKILSPAFTVQADETFKPRVEWSEMFRSYIDRAKLGWIGTLVTCLMSAACGCPVRPPATPALSWLCRSVRPCDWEELRPRLPRPRHCELGPPPYLGERGAGLGWGTVD